MYIQLYTSSKCYTDGYYGVGGIVNKQDGYLERLAIWQRKCCQCIKFRTNIHFKHKHIVLTYFTYCAAATKQPGQLAILSVLFFYYTIQGLNYCINTTLTQLNDNQKKTFMVVQLCYATGSFWEEMGRFFAPSRSLICGCAWFGLRVKSAGERITLMR